MACCEERKKVLRKMGRMVFEKPNDAVKLAFFRDEKDLAEIDGLDLTMLSEVRRDKNGAVEVKLIDRLEAAKTVLQELRAEGETQAADALMNIMKESGDV